MPFVYTGLKSLRDPIVFQSILASSVVDTGLAYDFEISKDLSFCDDVYDTFQCESFDLLALKDQPNRKDEMILTCLAIYAVALHRPFRAKRAYFVDRSITGIHTAMARRNPNELIALTFGIGISQLQVALQRSDTNIVYAPTPVDIQAIEPRDIRRCVHIIAENRNLDLKANNKQFGRSFHQLRVILRGMRKHRLNNMRKLI